MTGGWIRHGISIDGGPSIEDALVWWLQAPSKHCDLRLPFADREGLMSFAGTTTWEHPSLTWHPELELDPSAFTDTGVITWDGADMMEAGVFHDGSAQIPYVERWVRLPGSDGELLALSYSTEGVSGRLVATGPYALSIIDARPSGGVFVAAGWRLVSGTWTLGHRWPADATTPSPPVGVAKGAASVVLDDGLEWTVDEHHVPRDSHERVVPPR